MEAVRLYLSVFWTVGQIVTTIVLLATNWRAANGRLQRNPWIGIRTGATTRSDQAWVAGHRAALRLTPLYLLTTAATVVAVWVTLLCTRTVNVVAFAGIGGIGVLVLLALYSAIIAGRAAKSADDGADDRQRL